MERLRGKLKNDMPEVISMSGKRKYEEIQKPIANIKSRTLDMLVNEFEASAGNFDLFHSTLNGTEKILFKGHIESMRQNMF